MITSGMGFGGGRGLNAAPSAPPAAPAPIVIVEAGRVVGPTTPEAAQRDGLTLVDLSDEWLPHVFSEAPETPQPLRPYLIDLANGRLRSGSAYARAREDRTFEAFGISPSLNVLRRRLADRKRHACHDRVKDAVLEELSPKNVIPPEEPEKVPNPDPATVSETPMILTGRTISPRSLTALETRAVVAMQAHLRCEDLLHRKATRGRMDRRTVEGLHVYQRLHMLADSGRIDLDTRSTLRGDSREHDFRALLRALRERVVDATGLLEDGSALGVLAEVQGRLLDSPEFQPLPMRTTSTPPQGAPPAQGPSPNAPGETGPNVTAAPDLVAAATHTAAAALGFTSPDAVSASTLAAPSPLPSSRKAARKPPRRGPAPLPPVVALRLPPRPAYHGQHMDLRAEIDRGDVVLARPKLDKDGKKKWRPPVSDRPTLTLYVRVGKGQVALARWPTTIGGWKTIQKSDGTMALKYKESVTGEALWPEVLATPTWHPSPGMPTRKLLVKRGDSWEPKTEIIGPGYRAAYGLVAIVHHQIEGENESGEPQLMDHRIRTHGTPAYRSVKRGESSGCHRLHNHLALRLAGFLVRHRTHVRHGLAPEDYVRRLEYQGQQVALESDYKGYRFQLTPPVPVTVLDGEVSGNAKAVKRLVPMTVMP
ncbi:MAG: hypothetical protein KA712_01320 [Myxococcales bacterium]|nr:hypothetical protein [Myxococcales bacterium]